MFSNAKIQLYVITYFALLFVLGLVVSSHLPIDISPLEWGIATAAAVMFLVILHSRQRVAMCFSVLVPVLSGCFVMSADMEKMNRKTKPEYVKYKAIVLSNPARKGKTMQFDALVVETVDTHSCPFKVKASVYMPKNDELQLSVGDGIECFSVFSGVHDGYKSAFDYGRYLYTQGFRACTFIYTDNIRKSRVDESRLPILLKFRLCLMRLRSAIVCLYSANGLKGDNLAVVAALTLGDKSGVNAQVKDVYSKSGASHVLALSGLHIGIIYTLLTLLFGHGYSIGWRKLAHGIFLLLTVWGYVFLVGMPVSAVRSAMLLTVYSILIMSQRSYEPMNALSFAALMILLFSPMTVYDIGFQMSFVAVASILLLYKPIYRTLQVSRLKKFLVYRWLLGMVVLSLVAQIGIAPIVAYYFGRFSCVFLLSNFVVVPLAIVLLYGSVAMIVFMPLPLLQGMIVRVMEYVTGLMNGSLMWIASLPWASVDGIHVSVVQVLAYYALVPCVVMLIRLIMRRKMPNYKDYVFPDL